MCAFFKKHKRLFNRNIFILFGVISLVFIAFIIKLSLLLGSPATMYSDDAIYMSMARYFYEGSFGGIIHPIWTPLFPFFSAIFYKIVNEWGYAGRMVSVVSGSLLILPIYLIGKNYTNKTVGLLASLFAVFYYPLLHVSYQPHTESLQIFLFWMGILFYLKALETNKTIFALLSGIFWGLTFLTRSEAIFIPFGVLIFNLILYGLILKKYFRITSFHFKLIFFVLFSIYLIFAYSIYNGFVVFIVLLLFIYLLILTLFKDGFEIKTNLFKLFLFMLIGFSIFYIAFNGMLYFKYKKSPFMIKSASFINFPGHFMLNNSGTSTWAQDMDSLETFNVDSEFTKNFNVEIFKRYQMIIDSIMERIFSSLRIFFKYTSTANLIIFFIGVYWLIFRRKDYIKTIFLFTLLITISVAVATISSLEQRYFYFVSPLVPLAISFGVNYLLTFINFHKIKTIAILVFICFVIFFNIKHIYSRNERILFSVDLGDYYSLFSGKKVYKPESQITNLLKNKRVMATHESIGFHSRSMIIYSPHVKTLEELLDYSLKWKVDYIIASPGEISGYLSFLYTEPKNYPKLKLAVSIGPTYIYKVIY